MSRSAKARRKTPLFLKKWSSTVRRMLWSLGSIITPTVGRGVSNAIADARAVAEELTRKGFDVTLKTDLTSIELEQVFKAFFIDKGGDPDARLFVWFAGHGHTENGEGFLIPADAPRPDVGRKFKFAALPMRRFGEYVRLAESKHAFAVFDSCFSGTVFEGARALPPAAVTRATALPVRQFLTSGDAGQTVSDDGTFRKLFLRALRGEERVDANGDGFVTASEMGLFLGDRVTNLTRSKQTPRYGKLRDADWDRGDFVFAVSKARLSVGKPAAKSADGQTPEMMFLQSIQGSTNVEAYQAYLNQYPGGAFAPLAELKIKELAPKQTARRPESSQAAPTPAPSGERPRAWLGVSVQKVTGEIANSLSLGEARGALVSATGKDSPAKNAGINPGDIILSFGGQDIPAMPDLPRIVAERSPGDRVVVRVWREGLIVPIPVVLGTLKHSHLATAGWTRDGIGYRIVHSVKGIEIVQVEPNSDAAQKGLAPGDIIVEVDQHKVNSQSEFTAQIEKLIAQGNSSYLILVKRDGDLRFVALPLANTQKPAAQSIPPQFKSFFNETEKASPTKKEESEQEDEVNND